MKNWLFVFLLLISCVELLAQGSSLQGMVKDAVTQFPLEGISIQSRPVSRTVLTDENGRFQLVVPDGVRDLQISAIGYETKVVTVDSLRAASHTIYLNHSDVQLSEVMVTAGPLQQYRPISQVDIRLKGIDNSQEVLRMVPGLFIGQHAGGGKAEQMFLRGFDLDHGTDIAITVDGMPVNMVSHAHGQGYADLHFVIPELIDNVTFKKGTYYPEKGNFTTSGYVDFKTLNVLPQNSVKVEGGMFNTFRTVGMVNLLGAKAKAKQQSAYIASEYMSTRGYFDAPQNFHRLNVQGKYFGKVGNNSHLSFSLSTFSSKWNASGQIPDRAVESGMIGFYGAIDPDEGGSTSRSNANLQLVSTMRNGDVLKNQLYYTKYDFALFSNFTFFKVDPVNGDQIKQKESRHLYGYNGSYSKVGYMGAVRLTSEVGANIRLDRTHNSELSRTLNRDSTLEAIMLGDIGESNVGVYINESFLFSPRFSMTTGLRYDYLHSRYTDKLNPHKGKADAGILSPKLNFFYHPNNRTQLYLTTGRGFHSNDTRVAVPQNGREVLPEAYGADLGTIFKPTKNLMVNAALWYLWLEQEFVYVGDEGVVEPSGKSRRIGVDISARYQPLRWLYLDVDLNYAKGRAVEEPKGQDYLPLAPRFTSIGGVTVKTNHGFNGSLRYRYMADRPANEDNSTIAKGYFVSDAAVSYVIKKVELQASAQNLFNTKWKETQFDTESRLRNEPDPVTEIHFTPGTPFSLRVGLTYNF